MSPPDRRPGAHSAPWWKRLTPTQKRQHVASRRSAGETLQTIATDAGVSRELIRRVGAAAQSKTEELSVRLQNCLERAGVPVVSWVDVTADHIRSMKAGGGYGRVSEKELMEALASRSKVFPGPTLKQMAQEWHDAWKSRRRKGEHKHQTNSEPKYGWHNPGCPQCPHLLTEPKEGGT